MSRFSTSVISPCYTNAHPSDADEPVPVSLSLAYRYPLLLIVGACEASYHISKVPLQSLSTFFPYTQYRYMSI